MQAQGRKVSKDTPCGACALALVGGLIAQACLREKLAVLAPSSFRNPDIEIGEPDDASSSEGIEHVAELGAIVIFAWEIRRSPNMNKYLPT
jgi:hypothetical protein